MNNSYTISNGIVKIKLTQGQCVIIDEINLIKVIKYRWCAKRDKNNWYALAHIYKSNGRRTTLLMHRLIMELDFGDSREVDHNDGNGLNNLLNNLHIVNHSGNQHNRHGKSSRNGKTPTSLYRGVYYYKKRNCWRTQIVNNNIHINLGDYDNELEASRVYELAKIIRDNGGTNEEIKSLNISL